MATRHVRFLMRRSEFLDFVRGVVSSMNLCLIEEPLYVGQPGPYFRVISADDLERLPPRSLVYLAREEPPAEDITVAVLVNPLGVNEAALEVDVLPPLVAALLPAVAGALASFPLPEFFGLTLSGVEISRNGQFMTLYANLQ